MTYGLAKQLKDAGFLFKRTEIETVREPMTIGREKVYLPTLSELIEACGDKFTRLERANDLFDEKHYLYQAEYDHLYFGRGNTPEEAVAKLWLVINKQ